MLLVSSAQAQENGSLDVTVNTGSAPSSAASRGAVAAPAQGASKAKLPAIPKSSPTPAPNRGTLASRGSRPQEPQEAPSKVTVRPAKVVMDSVAVRLSRLPSSKILSVATAGQTLAVLSELDGFYGILMVNNTIGWVPKEAMVLMDYDQEVTLEQTPAPPITTSGSTTEFAERGGLSSKQRQVLREAFTYMGVPYVWAGNTRAGLDCSAFVKNVFSTVGVSLPRHSGHQTSVGQKITDTGELLPGDRLYFAMKGGSTITHTGIYIGEGLFIHASSNHKCVDVDNLFKSYVNKLVAIRRD